MSSFFLHFFRKIKIKNSVKIYLIKKDKFYYRITKIFFNYRNLFFYCSIYLFSHLTNWLKNKNAIGSASGYAICNKRESWSKSILSRTFFRRNTRCLSTFEGLFFIGKFSIKINKSNKYYFFLIIIFLYIVYLKSYDYT